MANNTLPVAHKMKAFKREKDMVNAQLSFPSDFPTHGMLFLFTQYKFAGSRQFVTGDSTTKVVGLGSLKLPMPESTVETNNARINGEMLNTVERALMTGGSAVHDYMGEIGDLVAAAAPAAMGVAAGSGIIKAGTAIGGKAASLFLATMGGGAAARTASRYMGMATGVVENNKQAIIWDGAELRNHSFTWKLMPRSETESHAIKEIVKTWQWHQAPEIRGHGAIAYYPSIVHAHYIGVDASHYPKLKPMMIRNVTADFSPNGQSVLAGGRPAAVTLTVDMLETDIIARSDIELEK